MKKNKNGNQFICDRFFNPVCGVSLLGILLFLILSFLGCLTADIELFEPEPQYCAAEEYPVSEIEEPFFGNGQDSFQAIQFLRDPVCKRPLSRRQYKNGFSSSVPAVFLPSGGWKIAVKFLPYYYFLKSHSFFLQLKDCLFVRAGPSCRC